jgi:hypothetical protein
VCRPPCPVAGIAFAVIVIKSNKYIYRVLRRMSLPKRDGVMGRWTKLHNEELHDLCSSPRIVRMMKSRRMRLAGHVA